MEGKIFYNPDKRDPLLYKERLSKIHSHQKVYTSCLICGSQESGVVGEKSGFSIIRCSDCTFIYVNPRPSEDTLRYIYDETYWTLYEPSIGSPSIDERVEIDYQAKLEKLYRDVLPYKKTGRLIDIGCSNGALVKRAEELGFESYGLELDKRIAERAFKYFQIKTVYTGTLAEQKFCSGYFDIVTMYDVLEHTFDPRTEMAEISRILKIGGLLVIETLTADSLLFHKEGIGWDYVQPPIHLNYFAQENLVRLINETGFKIIDMFCPIEDNIVFHLSR